ncbi:ABZJ_00895 family protein [Pontivivens nitratireducens]|uniref:Transmembrane protein n=1 Tax=Pontivivens nitratireducens TaxID=2758038 RepID=A0A6G7VN40_9RHOB|nr:ABZJ_00895 family protein [Pontibrevibacter nitratireducens]QIK41275.1 hypothetical protein G8E03_11130 [Pontibrevibacter nitratireducens]
MSTTPRTPYLGTYMIWLLVGVIGCIVVLNALSLIFGVAVGGGAMAAIPPMLAAMKVGEKWARERGVVPPADQAWRWSIVAAIAALAFEILATLLYLASMGGPVTWSLAAILAMGLALFTIVVIFINRYFLVLYAKRVLKVK